MSRVSGARTIRYCLIGCTKTTDAGRIKVQTESASHLCRRCEDQLHRWLTTIPDLYNLLPTFIEPGSTEKNPETMTTKAATAPIPVRLEVIDLLDTRKGRIWQGTAPAHDRRGALGTLVVHVERVIEERRLSGQVSRTVYAACTLLDRHRLWIAEQEWVNYFYDDLKQLHRDLSDATGDYRRPSVGSCHIETDDGPCDGPLFANPNGGVRCARCDATWDANQLRILGIAQAEARLKQEVG